MSYFILYGCESVNLSESRNTSQTYARTRLSGKYFDRRWMGGGIIPMRKFIPFRQGTYTRAR